MLASERTLDAFKVGATPDTTKEERTVARASEWIRRIAVMRLQLRNQGWRTIAQEPSTSVASALPAAAAEIGAAQEILPLSQIAGAITRRVHVHRGVASPQE